MKRMKVVSLKVACLAVLVIAVCAVSGFAQSSLTYGGKGNQEGYEVIPTSDGGFMIGGHNDNVTSKTQYWVVKVDRNGQVAWDSTYDLGFAQSFLWSIQPMKNGGALLGGYTGVQNSGQESALVVEIDANGKVLLERDVNYQAADHAHWCAQRPQGGFFWAGHTDSEGDPSGEMILERLDDNMDSVWQRTYELAPNSYEHAHCGTLTPDGGCVLAGHTEVGNLEHMWAVRVDSNGNEMWKKMFASAPNLSDSPYGIVTTHDGSFAIFGGVDNQNLGSSQMRLVVVDSAGNKTIDKSYGTGYSYAFSGIQCADGGYALIGYYAAGVDQQVLVVRTDAKGTQLWQKKYTGLGQAWGYAMFERKNQLVMVGGTSADANATSDLWVMYTDSLGKQVSYDTSGTKTHPQLIFTLNKTSDTWSNAKSDSLQGTLQNPGADSVHFTYAVQNAGAFFNYTSIAGAQEFFGTSQIVLGIGPKETLPVKIRVQPYEPPAKDTAHICYVVTEVGDAANPPLTNCITLYPEFPNAVATTSPAALPELTVFPNPARLGAKGIAFSCSVGFDRIEIRNVLGNLVWESDGVSASSISWDGRDMHGMAAPDGEYFVRATTQSGVVTSKLVIQN